jgi:hypothetical protein
MRRLCQSRPVHCQPALNQAPPDNTVTIAGARWVGGTYMNAPYASLSIHDSLKVKIAPVHWDFECSFWLRSLMGFAG